MAYVGGGLILRHEGNMMIDATSVPTDALVAFDNMMVELVAKGVHLAPLASLIWAEVLRELEARLQPNKKGGDS